MLSLLHHKAKAISHLKNTSNLEIGLNEAQMSALKSHMKCELSTISSRIELLSQFEDTKTNNLYIQQKVL